jgi:hypothetical protein
MDATRAQNLEHYSLQFPARRKRGKPKPIRLVSATYSSATDTVTLTLGGPLALNRPIQLTVLGTPPGGLTDTDGNFLGGQNNGGARRNTVLILNPKSL